MAIRETVEMIDRKGTRSPEAVVMDVPWRRGLFRLAEQVRSSAQADPAQPVRGRDSGNVAGGG
jgi:hypothetical protein